jgi:hypothetical protein
MLIDEAPYDFEHDINSSLGDLLQGLIGEEVYAH